MIDILYIPVGEFHRVRAAVADKYDRLALLADMCRLNTLAAVKRAGSGHLGSSLSSLDIVTYLYFEEMNTLHLGVCHPDRDIYYSSKGHDVPGLYSVLYAAGVLPESQYQNLRRHAGTCGHPDASTPGMEANTGSLGMGISKGKGHAIGKRMLGRGGRVLVMVGDGEFQEGQNFEALQSAAHAKVENLVVIMDHNKVQSDKPVAEICGLGDLDAKLRSFGWHVARCDGHDFAQLEAAMRDFNALRGAPKFLIADTIKGRGISFMEHPAALRANNGTYKWHAGAPDDDSYWRGHTELLARVNARLDELGMAGLELAQMQIVPEAPSAVTREYVADAFGAALVKIGRERKDLVVLDADLAVDCRTRQFEFEFPDRFVQCGIAEQDMVSTAGGLARQGLLPVVNSFASFLAARSNEQIYNNACERSRIIYVCHYSGLIPAGPGQSHQSIRDISLLSALPGFEILQPANAEETRMALEYCVGQSKSNCVLRLVIGPSPRRIDLPEGYSLIPGRGCTLTEGGDAILFAYGPVMLNEALAASELLGCQGVAVKVVNMPWLNRVDVSWLTSIVEGYASLAVLEDHSPIGGLADMLLTTLANRSMVGEKRLVRFGVDELPAWGTPAEALRFHGLDGATVARRLLATIER